MRLERGLFLQAKALFFNRLTLTGFDNFALGHLTFTLLKHKGPRE